MVIVKYLQEAIYLGRIELLSGQNRGKDLMSLHREDKSQPQTSISLQRRQLQSDVFILLWYYGTHTAQKYLRD